MAKLGENFVLGGLSIMNIGGALAGLLAAAMVVSAPSVRAQSSVGVEPLLLEVAPNQAASMRMRNSSDKPVTVEVAVFERLIDENGVQTRRPADDDFLILPPQAVVPGKSLQVFRLQSVTPPESKSRSYFVSIRQVPVQLPALEGGGARVQLLFAFDSAVHVVPRNTKAEPVFVSAKPATKTIEVPTDEFVTDEEGERTRKFVKKEVPAVAVTVRNDGSKFFYLQNFRFTGNSADASGTTTALPDWSYDQIISAAGVTLVPPGATRTFTLPILDNRSVASVTMAMQPR